MKKIIEGRRYDTETAREVASWWNGLGWDDFGYLKEALYLTKSGAWFIHGVGGAMTGYAQPSGSNAFIGGAKITPVSPEQAQAWLERHNKTEAIEKHFSVVDA